MTESLIKLKSQRDQLVTWLVDKAYPLWFEQGVDKRNGGFVELLDQHGNGMDKPRRSRVHPRQIYSFAMAKRFGWHRDINDLVRGGIDFFFKYYLREDGLFRTLCDANGKTLDDRAFLYDQAFALLGFAYAARALNARDEFESHALALREAIEQHLRTQQKGFICSDFHSEQRLSNPHMHLLEACLAWAETGLDSGWTTLAEEIADLAMAKFIQPSGALKECFDDDWQPAAGLSGRIVEPGHQFEWAWLLLRCNRNDAQRRRDAALKLISIGEQHGVRNGVVINAVLDDFSINDASARFWPQTERIKAAVLAAHVTGDDQYWSIAHAAVHGLMPYLNTPLQGLWLDSQLPDGTRVDAPSPASSFYHLVAAIAELDEGMNGI